MSLAQRILKIQEEEVYYDFAQRLHRRRGVARDIMVCSQNMRDVKKILDAHGISFWLMYGTLLGAYRDGTFIPYDNDSDIGLFREVKEDFFNIIHIFIEEEGFELIRTASNDNIITLMRDDEYIDFIFWERGSLPFDTLTDLDFLGTTFKIPDNTEALLEEIYGADWNTPKENTHATQYFGL